MAYSMPLWTILAKWPAPGFLPACTKPCLALGTQRVEGRLHLGDVLVGAADTSARSRSRRPQTPPETPQSTKPMPLSAEHRGVDLVVGVLGVAAVDDEVALAEQVGELGGSCRGSGRRPGPSPRPPWAAVGPGSCSTISARLADVGEVGVAVEADDGAGRRCASGCACCRPSCRGRRVRCACSDSDPHGMVTRGVPRSGEQAARHQQVAERRDPRAAVGSTCPLITTGLDDWVKASSTIGSSMAVSPSSRNCGLKPVVMSSPVDLGLDRLRRPAPRRRSRRRG